MIELEKTYLAQILPEGLGDCKHKEIIDVYIPKEDEHPKLRLRRNGDRFELTKKEPIREGDASHQEEQTIKLTEVEFNALNSQIKGKRTHKFRYFYDYNGYVAEFDVFQDALTGLVVVDFEFETIKDKDAFTMPDFCLADVTQEQFIAGGMICGKTYADIAKDLDRFDYRRLTM